MRNIGDLKEIVTVQKRAPTTTAGIGSDEWTDVGQYRAEVLHLSQKNWAAANAQYTQEIITVHLWSLTGKNMMPGLRVIWQGRPFLVTESIPNKPIPGITELRCTATAMEGTGL